MKWFLKKLMGSRFGKNVLKDFVQDFFNEKVDKFQKEAEEYVRKHGANKLGEFIDKYQKEANDWIDGL